MSGLFEKRADGSTRRMERNKKENKARRKRRTITVSVTAVMLVLFAASLVVNSNYIRRTLPAISIGGHSFTAVEFDYFYNNAYQEYANWVQEQFGEYEDYVASLLPSSEIPLSNQVYDADTGETWADFFTERAIANMSELLKFYNAAEAAGFQIPPEGVAQIEDAITSIMDEARSYVALYPNQYTSPDGYLHALFGSAINERGLRNVMMFVQRAVTYSESMRTSFTFTPGELEEYYLENRDLLDIFSFRVLFVEPVYLDREDYASDEDYEEATDNELAVANLKAQRMADEIGSEEDFIAVAREYDADVYGDPLSTRMDQMGEELDPDFAEWLTGEEPLKFGDMKIIDYPYGSALMFFIARNDNSYFTTAMRQILLLRDELSPDSFPAGVEDPEYIDLLADIDSQAGERAKEVLGIFTSGEASEERFAELVAIYSDDNIEGGYYDRIAKFMYQSQTTYTLRVVDEIEQWLFDRERAVGDFELIRTEAYGYHIVYFMGFGERMRDIIAEDRMGSSTFLAWGESLPAAGEVTRHWAFMFTMA